MILLFLILVAGDYCIGQSSNETQGNTKLQGCQTCKLQFECINSVNPLPGFVDGVITYSISFDHNNCYVLTIGCGEDPNINPRPTISIPNLKTSAMTWAVEQVLICREDGSWVPVGKDIFSCAISRSFNDPAPAPPNPTCRKSNPAMPPILTVPTKTSNTSTTSTTMTTSSSGKSTISTTISSGSGPATTYTTTSSRGNPTIVSVSSSFGSDIPTITVFSTDPNSVVFTTTSEQSDNPTTNSSNSDSCPLNSDSTSETPSLTKSSGSHSSTTSSKNSHIITKKLSTPGGSTVMTVTSSTGSPTAVWSTEERKEAGIVTTVWTMKTGVSSNCDDEEASSADTKL